MCGLDIEYEKLILEFDIRLKTLVETRCVYCNICEAETLVKQIIADFEALCEQIKELIKYKEQNSENIGKILWMCKRLEYNLCDSIAKILYGLLTSEPNEFELVHNKLKQYCQHINEIVGTVFEFN